MRIIQMKPDSTNVIGRAGENLAVQARFRVTEEYLSRYGDGTFTLCLLRPEDSEPYAVQTEIDGGDLVWNVTATDTQQQGFAYAELQYQAGSILAKSVRYRLFVEPSLGQASEEPPEPWQRWVDDVLAAGNAAVLASQTAADSALQAARSAEDTEAAAQRAEAAAERPYLSLERLGPYLYDVSFDTMPQEVIFDDLPGGGCSSYVQGGKLYRNLDWAFTETASFRVRCKEFEGMSFVSGLTDGNLDDDLIEALPFRVTDGINTRGIMVSTHVLFNDWDWHGSGSTPLTLLPYRILTRVRSMDTLEEDLADVLNDLASTPALDTAEYLLQFLVTDGETTCAILPPESSDGSYVIVDVTDNPKLANFRWVSDETVSREDLQLRPTGVERWNLMPTSLENLCFTKAYEAPTRLSEFIGIDETDKDSTDAELEAIYDTAHALYEVRERDGRTWQTMHSVVYSSAGMEALYVQEDWNRNYVSAGSSDGGTDGVWMPFVSEEGTISWQRSASATAPAARNIKGPAGADGQDGQDGAPGVGVPEGGTTGQVLAKKSGTDYDTQWVNPPGGGEPAAYLKSASVSQDGNTLTLTKKDNTTVQFAPAGSGGTSDHTQLTNRDAANQHPISAITGLQSALDAKADADDIPAEVTESTVSGWGFTKNTGTYSKPTGGIPKTDLASAVQTSLGRADSALQSESDPVFAASPAAGITASNISSWNSKGTYSKPSSGIPKTDLASAVQTSLGRADTAVQPETGKGLFSGSYNDLTDKPTIPAEVTESTVSGWGFTKNTGTYSKPTGGIPKTDLASAVKTSLGRADTALQSFTETDPVFSASPAAGITASDISAWNGKQNALSTAQLNAANSGITESKVSTYDGYATTISGKEPSIAAGTSSQYWRGDKTWQTLDKSAVGLGNVQNVSVNRSTNVNAADTNYSTLMARGEKLLDATTFDGVSDWTTQLVNGAIAWKYE